MSKIKVLVTGGQGLVGSLFIEKNPNFQIFAPVYPEFDLTKPDTILKAVTEFNPDWIINYAAFTDVNASELQKGDESGLAWQINVEGVKNLLNIFKSKNIIQISTDMVFPGNLSQPGPYAEDDKISETSENLTWYGWTKNRGEKLVAERGGTVLRIIYPVRASFDAKMDYLRGPLKRFVDGKMYPLFNDQQVSISYIPEINETLKKIIENDAHGIYHASSDTTTPYELIKRTLDELGADTSAVQSCSVIDFLKTQNNPTRYPVYGGLKTKLTEEEQDLHFSTWQTVIELLIADGLKLPSAN